MSKKVKTAIIAAGASGGHIFPALAVADKLKAQGFRCVFVGRAGSFSSIVEDGGYELKELPASAWNVRSPIKKLAAIFNLMRAFARAFKIIHQEKASVVFGTGGYATVASVLAAKLSGVPTIIQEQNVLPGRANRFLSKWVDRVCLSFESSRHYLRYREGVMVVTGNPIREKIIKVRDTPRKENDKFNLLIVGGSQGAKILSDIVPHAINLLPYTTKRRIEIVQQTRAEDLHRVKNIYHDMGVEAKVETFFDNLEEIMLNSNIIIARSGASTVNEAAILGRAAIYIPLKLADGHQLQNAKAMETIGAALLIEQNNFTPEKLVEKLSELIEDKAFLAKMEKVAYDSAVVDAASNVADEVIKLSEQDILHLGEEFNE